MTCVLSIKQPESRSYATEESFRIQTWMQDFWGKKASYFHFPRGGTLPEESLIKTWIEIYVVELEPGRYNCRNNLQTFRDYSLDFLLDPSFWNWWKSVLYWWNVFLEISSLSVLCGDLIFSKVSFNIFKSRLCFVWIKSYRYQITNCI